MFRLLLVSALALSACTVYADALASATPAQPERTSDRPADVLFDESFSVRDGGALAVDLGAEAVVLKTVSGSRARVTVEGRGRDAAAELRRRRFTARTTRGGLEVKTNPPRGTRNRNDVRFTVTIEVPRRFDAALDLGSGAVSVADLEGDLSVDTGSGAVRVGAVRGDVAIDTGSGAVRVDRVTGRLAVDTGSGAVAVGEVEGPVVIDTGSGAVRVAVRGGHDVAVDTGSGGVTVRVPARPGWGRGPGRKLRRGRPGARLPGPPGAP